MGTPEKCVPKILLAVGNPFPHCSYTVPTSFQFNVIIWNNICNTSEMGSIFSQNDKNCVVGWGSDLYKTPLGQLCLRGRENGKREEKRREEGSSHTYFWKQLYPYHHQLGSFCSNQSPIQTHIRPVENHWISRWNNQTRTICVSRTI